MGQVITCRVCGKTKGIEDFSKSYKDTCKDCVAAKMRKAREKKANDPKPINLEHGSVMRTVVFKEWVPGVETEEYKNADYFECIGMDRFVEGTNCNIEKEGLFHGFFPSVTENNDGSFGNHTYALVETEDGSIIAVTPTSIRFVDKPRQ